VIDSWYYVFLSCIVVLWFFSTPQDSNALRIVLFFSLTGIALVTLVTTHIHGAWKLSLLSGHEVLTIVCLFIWAPNRTGFIQACLLWLSWSASMLCYLHLKSGGQLPFFYDHYKHIIQAVAVGQLVACHDTMHSIAMRIYRSTISFRFSGEWVHPDATVRASILRREGTNQNKTGL